MNNTVIVFLVGAGLFTILLFLLITRFPNDTENQGYAFFLLWDSYLQVSLFFLCLLHSFSMQQRSSAFRAEYFYLL
jgi:hypothetical protein